MEDSMRFSLPLMCLAVVTLGASSAFASTGTIRYKVGSAAAVDVTDIVANPDIPINVGTISSTVLLRIWDPSLGSGLPDDDVGRITITGSWSSGGELRILVAGESDAWPDDAGTPLESPGLRKLGLNSVDGILVSTTNDLHKHTRLSAFVTAEMNGPIQVGQVHRVQCGRTDEEITEGIINSAITAMATNNDFQSGESSIEYISAGDAIVGTISATSASFDPTNSSTYASIRKIVIGPSLDASGLTGDILAEDGTIFRIFSSGDIGAALSPVNIRAADGIREIRTIVEDGGAQLAEGKNIHADIDAGLDYYPHSDYVFGGGVFLVESGGDLTGSIHAGNMYGNPDNFFAPYNSLGGGPGIMVQGNIDAPITIDHVAMHTNIVASAILEPIVIGRHFKGAIVAYGTPSVEDPSAGTIVSVSIGRGESDDYGPDRGFCATVAPQVNLDPEISDVVRWFTHDVNFGSLGAIDGLIRAEQSIGTVDISRMGHRWLGSGLYKHGKPRIESPVIDSLTIDDLEAGAVWSGLLEYDTGDVDNDPENDFVAIGAATIGSMSPTADIWITGCPLLRITGDLRGEIHLPSLEAGEAIVIDGGLLNLADNDFGCLMGAVTPFVCGYIEAFSDEESPRGSPSYGDEPSDGIALYGRIRIVEPASLFGQIVINADSAPVSADPPEPATSAEALPFWSGVVQVDYEMGRISLSADLDLALDTRNQGPAYCQFSDFLGAPVTMGVGGGAVGLVPYQLYTKDSMPSIKDQPVGPVDPVGFDAGSVVVKIRFFGPVTALSAADSILITKDDVPANSNFAISFQSVNGSQREIRIGRTSGGDYVLGDEYKVVPVLDSEDNNLFCDLLGAGPSETVVARFEYFFAFEAPDCRADFNEDTFVDPDDLSDFITCFFLDVISPGTCDGTPSPERNADFNGDTFRDPDDLSDFITIFFLTVASGC